MLPRSAHVPELRLGARLAEQPPSFDQLGMMRQLDVIPTPEEPGPT